MAYETAVIDAVKSVALFDLLGLPDEKESKAQGKKLAYRCPLCGHSRIVNPLADGRWYCQRCQKGGNVFQLVAYRDGISVGKAFNQVMAAYAGGRVVTVSKPRQAQEEKRIVAGDAWKKTCARYLRACAAALPGSDGEEYMRGRGFNSNSLRRFGIGFDAKAKGHRASWKFGIPGVVYPYSRRLDYYGLRFLKPYTDKRTGKVIKAAVPPLDVAGNEPLYNAAVLYGGCDAVVVCEGAFDSMAILQGGEGLNVGAVSLGGTDGGRLVKLLEEKPTGARLLIALDNDEPGKAGALALAAKLESIGADFKVIDSNAAFAGLKDACDLLAYDSGLMSECVQFMINEPAAWLER